MPQGYHHHENKRDKSEERNRQAVIRGKLSTVNILDNPLPPLETLLTSDEISDAIREVVGQFDDTFQDVWVEVLERRLNNLEAIRKVAKEISHKNANKVIGERYKTRDLDQPINNEPGASPLIDFIPAKPVRTDEEIDAEIAGETQYVASSTGKINLQGYVHLDREVYMAIKKAYPHDSLNHAIRKLANMPPPSRMKLGWHKWEEAIIRERYPWGGARAVALDVHRKEGAIESHAKKLGIKVGTLNGYKPCPDWLNIPELAEKLSCTYEVAARLEKTGVIESIRIPQYHQGHDGVFFTPDALRNYLDRKDIIKKERMQRHIEARLKTISEKKFTKRESDLLKKEQEIRELLKKSISRIPIDEWLSRKESIIESLKSKKLETKRTIFFLNDQARDIRIALKRVVRVRTEVKEQRALLLSQKREVESKLKAEVKEQRALLLSQKREVESKLKAEVKEQRHEVAKILHESRSLKLWENELKIKEGDLSNREETLARVRERYDANRRKSVSEVKDELKAHPEIYKVARTGKCTHYVTMLDENAVYRCRHSAILPLDTYIKVHYDPFVSGVPTCKRCLKILDATKCKQNQK